MTKWVVITLMAFMGTVFNTGDHCMEPVESQVSSVQSVALNGAVQISQSDTSSHKPTPAHQDCFCNHAHCCGMILNQYQAAFDLPWSTVRVRLGSSRLLSVDLKLPIKPPAA